MFKYFWYVNQLLMVMFNSFLSVYQRVLLWWNLLPRGTKTSHLAGAGPSSANPPSSRRQTASYRKRSDPSGWNDRKPAIFQGKKCEDLIHKDGRLEILQKWKFVSPKIGICHWLICVRRRLNIKLCEVVHPQLHEDITLYGTHYCRRKSGRRKWIPTQQN